MDNVDGKWGKVLEYIEDKKQDEEYEWLEGVWSSLVFHSFYFPLFFSVPS